MAAVVGDPDVAHAAAAPSRFPGRLADARRPAHLRPTRPQLVTERTALRLVLEQRNGHLNDHARAGRNASMITAAGSEPGPGGVGPGAGIRAGCADSGGGGQSQHRVGLGHGGPDARSGLAVCPLSFLMTGELTGIPDPLPTSRDEARQSPQYEPDSGPFFGRR